MRYNCDYLECIHTYGPGSHNIETRHIHLSCLLFHHLLSTFQRTHYLYSKVSCLNKIFHPTNHHICCIHHRPTIVLCIPTSMRNHHQTCNNHIRTDRAKDNRTLPRHSCQDIHTNHCIYPMMAHRTLVKVWNLRNYLFSKY